MIETIAWRKTEFKMEELIWLYHKIQSFWKWKQNPWRIYMNP